MKTGGGELGERRRSVGVVHVPRHDDSHARIDVTELAHERCDDPRLVDALALCGLLRGLKATEDGLVAELRIEMHANHEERRAANVELDGNRLAASNEGVGAGI